MRQPLQRRESNRSQRNLHEAKLLSLPRRTGVQIVKRLVEEPLQPLSRESMEGSGLLFPIKWAFSIMRLGCCGPNGDCERVMIQCDHGRRPALHAALLGRYQRLIGFPRPVARLGYRRRCSPRRRGDRITSIYFRYRHISDVTRCRT